MPLSRFFAWLDRALRAAPPPAEAPGLVSPPAGTPERSPHVPHASAALLSVDDGGQYLLAGGERLTLGHVRAARADLCFLADVGALHAELAREDSLQEGPGWRIRSCGEELVTLGGRRVERAGRRLAAGELVRLGENLEFRYTLPDPASASALLELLRGAECAGAHRIVLLADGPGGRLRIGSAPAHLVRVPGLDFELALEKRGAELELASEPPLLLSGAERCRLPFPPRERVQVTCGAPRGSRPPFALSLEPVERPAGGAARP